MAEPATLAAVHGVAVAVGPQTPKVTVPVGEPAEELPVTVAVSTEELPTATVAGLSDDARVGVEVEVDPVTWRHSVVVSLSLTGE